jgi:hypothetical protein
MFDELWQYIFGRKRSVSKSTLRSRAWKDRGKFIVSGTTRIRDNFEKDNLSAKRILRKKKYRDALNYIQANQAGGYATSVDDIGHRICRTLRRSGLIKWSHGTYAVVPSAQGNGGG